MNDLPETAIQLVANHIQSVAKLEVLLLLRAHSADWIAADDVARALYMQPSMMTPLLSELVRSGLAEVSDEQLPRYQFRPQTTVLEQAVKELAELYQHRRVAVVGLIHSAPSDQIRRFADAFRIRKEK